MFEKLQQMKVSQRFRLSFGIIIVLYIGIIMYNINSIDTITDNITKIYKTRLLSIQSLLEADRDSYQSKIAISEIMYLMKADHIDQELIKAKLVDVTDNIQQVEMRFDKFKAVFAHDEPDNKYFAIFGNAFAKVDEYTLEIKNRVEISDTNGIAPIYFGTYEAEYNTMRDAIDQLTEASSEFTRLEYEESMSKANQMSIIGIVSFIVLLTVLVLIAFVLSKSIGDQLGCEPFEAAELAKKLAEGDLSYLFVKKDKEQGLYKDMKHMVEKLKDVITSVVNTSRYLASASDALSNGSQGISEGANDQAASAEEISASMEEMAANIQQNTDNAKRTESIAIQSADDIMESSLAVGKTVDSMRTISEKIGVISEISRLTNILALNAAVEAARAGEHGKGFAVVADEVRKLAERSEVAARDITELAGSSLKVAENSGQLLSTVVPNIQETAKLVQNIVAASVEQNEGSTQVNDAIQNLNNIVQENAAGAEEMASSSEELSSQAEVLRQTVNFFKV